MKKYKMKIHGQDYEAKIVEFSETMAKITVNGVDFEVEFEHEEKNKPTQVIQIDRTVPAPPEIKKVETNEKVSENKKSTGIEVKAPIPGVIVNILVAEGDAVKTGDILLILEAMKMESEIVAPNDGIIEFIHAKDKAAVREGDLLMTIS